MTQPENQIFAFCRRMGKSRIAPSRLDCGVYVIFNVEKGRLYIGQSGKLLARYSRHFSELKAGVHENTLMQSDWNECGEDAFSFAVYTIAAPECLVQIEAELIELCFGEYCYNRPQGGKREGAGRPSLVAGDKDSTTKFLVAMTKDQRDKVKQLGGAQWIRKCIDDAAMPSTKKESAPT